MVLPSSEVAILTKHTRKEITQTHKGMSPQPASNLVYCRYLIVYLFRQLTYSMRLWN